MFDYTLLDIVNSSYAVGQISTLPNGTVISQADAFTQLVSADLYNGTCCDLALRQSTIIVHVYTSLIFVFFSYAACLITLSN